MSASCASWIARVKDGTLSRRDVQPDDGGSRAGGADGGADAGRGRGAAPADAQAKPAFTPARRGGGGELKVLWWQAVSILNPHLAVGVKDNDGSRIFNEPLVAFDPDGNLVPSWPPRSRRSRTAASRRTASR